MKESYENGKTESYTIEVPATVGKLPDVISFIEQHLEEKEVSPGLLMKITMSAEEIFVNIASYAYVQEGGTATLHMDLTSSSVTLTFIDSGIPFDPLAKPDPDVTLSASERGIGGLGIFMTKNAMDKMSYEYRDGKNILSMQKNF